MSALQLEAPLVEATVDLTRDEAADLTARIRGVAAELVELVRRAYVGRAWAALDYPSWPAYLEAEVGSALRGLPIDQRQGVLGVLDGAGMSVPAIAPVIGRSTERVRAELRLVRGDAEATPRVGVDGKTYTKAPVAAVKAKVPPKTSRVEAMLLAAGPDGLTSAEVGRRMRWHHGMSSSTCTALVEQRRAIVSPGAKRDGYRVLVHPEHQADPAASEPLSQE